MEDISSQPKDTEVDVNERTVQLKQSRKFGSVSKWSKENSRKPSRKDSRDSASTPRDQKDSL